MVKGILVSLALTSLISCINKYKQFECVGQSGRMSMPLVLWLE